MLQPINKDSMLYTQTTQFQFQPDVICQISLTINLQLVAASSGPYYANLVSPLVCAFGAPSARLHRAFAHTALRFAARKRMPRL